MDVDRYVKYNRIGKGLMTQEGIPLGLANETCDMCRWLEQGYQTSDDGLEVEAYAVEILLHRRSFHVSSSDHVN